MLKILLVEDDDNVREPLAEYLRQNNLEVFEADSISKAQSFLDQVDLGVFDWNLPDGEGLELIRSMRKDGNSTPVILLTARKDIVDRVVGLEIGADDYMCKPFEPRELLARINLRVRKNKTEETLSENIQLGPLNIKIDTREVLIDDQFIDMTRKEFDLLLFLARSPNRVFTRNELLDEVWGLDESTESRAVDNHMFQLRKKIGKKYFKTIHGVGYKLCL